MLPFVRVSVVPLARGFMVNEINARRTGLSSCPGLVRRRDGAEPADQSTTTSRPLVLDSAFERVSSQTA
jgi:hypothetical protein